MNQTRRPTLVLDACMAITFGNAGALDFITDSSRYRVTIASRAVGEVVRPPACDALEKALVEGQIETISIDLSVSEEQEALVRFDARPAFRGRGDAEVLALALARDCAVCSDERAIQHVIRESLGPEYILSTLDMIVFAMREDRITVTDAERLLERLDVGPACLRRLEAEGRTLPDLI